MKEVDMPSLPSVVGKDQSADEASQTVAPPEQKREHHFGFVGGSLAIKTAGYGAYNGSGHFAFSEDDLEWDEDQETGRVCRWVRVEKADLLEIRDFLNKMFPGDAA